MARRKINHKKPYAPARPVAVGDGLSSATHAMVGQSQPNVAFKYRAPSIDLAEFYNCYDTSQLAQLLINTLPEDTVSEWREWQAKDEDVNRIEAVERRFNLRKQVRDLQVYAAIEGEAMLYFDDGTKPSEPMDVSRAGRGSLRFVSCLRRQQYTYADTIKDPLSEWYGHPLYYQITTEAGAVVYIHPSRVARWVNNPSPSRESGLPALTSGIASIKQYESVMANTAFLVQKARTTVLSAEGLMDNVVDPQTEAEVIKRYGLVNYQEGNQGMIVLDKEREAFATHAYSFGGLDQLIQRIQQNVSALWGYPVTRIFDRTGGGLGTNGQSSLTAYYQSVNRRQANLIGPLLDPFDELLVRSALGSYPDDIYYNWRPLEKPTQKEIQEIGKMAADTLKTAIDGGFISPDVANPAFISRMAESGCFPGIEADQEEWQAAGGEIEPNEADLAGRGEGDTVTP